MDYEKKYKEALERAKRLHSEPTGGTERIVCEQIFPELKESEDERIRKELCKAIWTYVPTEEGQEYIAWLEKQKVLTEEEDLQGKEYVLWCIKQAKKHTKDENEMGTCWLAEQWLEKQGESYTKKDVDNAFIEGMAFAKDELEKQIIDVPKWKYKKDHTPLLRDSIILNKYGGVAKSPSGAIVSDVWILDYDELIKLPKEELEKQGEQKHFDYENANIQQKDFAPKVEPH